MFERSFGTPATPLAGPQGLQAGPQAATDVRAAYAICREMTRVASKTFYLASRFLSLERSSAVQAVYAFCRTADDIADGAGTARERLAAIDELERNLLEAHAGRPSGPIFIAYADAVRRFDIPLEPALLLLGGARMDVTIRRYATYAALCEYCHLVASTVGLLVAPILGFSSPDALEYGIVLGRAMQLTNILRDVGEDAQMGRIYLPAEDLARFDHPEERIFARVVDERFIALMRFEIERVRELYAQAEPGIALLAPESRYTVRLALTLYRRILASIERNAYDVFRYRAHVPLRAKLATALAVAVAR